MSRPAYPITCQCTLPGAPPITVQIVRLVPFGGQFQVQGSFLFRALQDLELSFALPVLGSHFVEKVKIVKVFETLVGPSLPEATRTMTIEFHFTGMSASDEKNIVAFLEKIGQKVS